MTDTDYFALGANLGTNIASQKNQIAQFNQSLQNDIQKYQVDRLDKLEEQKTKQKQFQDTLNYNYQNLWETKRHNLAGENLNREKFNYEYGGGGNLKNSLLEAKNAGVINDVAGYFNPEGEANRKFNAELSEFNYDGKDVNGSDTKKNILTNRATQSLLADIGEKMEDFNQAVASPVISSDYAKYRIKKATDPEYNKLEQINGGTKKQLTFQDLLDPSNAGMVLTDERKARVAQRTYKKLEDEETQKLREQTGDQYATLSNESKAQLKNYATQETNELMDTLKNGGLGRIKNKFQKEFNDLGQNSNTYNTESFFSGRYKELGGSLAGGTYVDSLKNRISNDINQKNTEIDNDPIKTMAIQNLSRNMAFRQQPPQMQNAIVMGQAPVVNQGINNIVDGKQPNKEEIQQNNNNYLARTSIPIEKEAEITNKSPREINNERQEQKSLAIISSASPFVQEAFNSNLKQAEEVINNSVKNQPKIYDIDIAKKAIDQKQQARETVANVYGNKLTPAERDELLGKTSGLDKAMQNFFYSAVVEPLKSVDRLIGGGKSSDLMKFTTAEADQDAKQYRKEHPVLSIATSIMGDVASLGAGEAGLSKFGLKMPSVAIEAGDKTAMKLAKNAINLGIKGAIYNGALSVAKSANDINEEQTGLDYFKEFGSNLAKSFRDGAIIENIFGVAGYGLGKVINKFSSDGASKLQERVQAGLSDKISEVEKKINDTQKSEALDLNNAQKSEAMNQAYNNLSRPGAEEKLATEINKKIEKGQKGYARFKEEHSEKLSQPLTDKVKEDLKNQFSKDYEKLGMSQREEHNAKNVEKFLNFIDEAKTGNDLIELSNLATSLPKSSESTGLYERFKNFTGKTLNDITGEDFNAVRNEYKQSKELQKHLIAEGEGTISNQDLVTMRNALGKAKISDDLASNLLKNPNIRPVLADTISNNIASKLKKIPDNFSSDKDFGKFIADIEDLNNQYSPFFKRNLPEFQKIQEGLNAYKNNAIELRDSFFNIAKMTGGIKEAKTTVQEVGKNITVDNFQELSKNITEAFKKQSNDFLKNHEIFTKSTPDNNVFKNNDLLRQYFEKNPKERDRIFDDIYKEMKSGITNEPLITKNEIIALLASKGTYVITKFVDIARDRNLKNIIDRELTNLILNPVGVANKSNAFMGNILKVRKAVDNLYSIRDNTALKMSAVKEYKKNE